MTKVSKITRADLDKAILLREAVTDYILADALDGVYREQEWGQMHAAFSTTDTAALTKLAADLKRNLDFVEPGTVLKSLSRAKFRALDTSGLTRVIRETPGTRLYARTLLEANIEETPFG